MAISDFIKGFTGTVLSEWEKRDLDERDVKKARMLEQLRRETSDYEFKRRAEYEETRPDDKSSGPDYAAGKYIVRDAKGRVVSERPLTSSEIEDRKFDIEGKTLDRDYKRKSIDNIDFDNNIKTQELGLRRQGLAESAADRAERRKDRAGSGYEHDPDKENFDIADALVNRYKAEVSTAIEAGANPSEIRAGAVAIAKNSKVGSQAEQEFLDFINRRTRKHSSPPPIKK